MGALSPQRAQWDIWLPRGKNCPGTIVAPVLPLNYPHHEGIPGTVWGTTFCPQIPYFQGVNHFEGQFTGQFQRRQDRDKNCLGTMGRLFLAQDSEMARTALRATASERKRHINSFHINFLCRPSSPGLSQGLTGFVPGTNPVKSGFHHVNKEKTQVCPRFSPDLSRGQTRWNPRDKPGVVPRPTGQKSLCLRAFFLPEPHRQPKRPCRTKNTTP